MKHNRYSIFFILCILFTNFIKPYEPTKLFLGSINIPTTFNSNFCLYYKGEKLTTEDATNNTIQFSFLESQQAQEIFIVVSNHITYVSSDSNTVLNLQTTNNEYKCYKLSAAQEYNNQTHDIDFFWKIEEAQLQKNIIPDNSLILLFNPNFISKLICRKWKNNKNIRLLPNIELNIHTNREELNKAIDIARLAAIDLDTFHHKSQTANNSKKTLLRMVGL